MIRRGNLVGLVLAVLMAASSVWSQPLCKHSMCASQNSVPGCHMAGMTSLPSVAQPPSVSCCRVSTAKPVPISVLTAPSDGVGLIVIHKCSPTDLPQPTAQLEFSNWAARPCSSALQARLCTFLI
jgi:hypothetical protein